MKKLVLLITFIGAFSMMARAQMVQKSPEQRAAHMVKSLQKKLNLTADQNSSIYSVYLTQATRMDSLKTNPPADKRAYNQTRKNITQSARQDVLSVLNNDQQKQFMELEQVKKERHAEKKTAAMGPQG